jgi:pilus assembly protein Flp/PilA
MLQFMQRLVHGRKNEDGASAVEYGLLVAAIAAIIVIIVFALGNIVKGSFSSTCSAIASGNPSAGSVGSCTG